MTTAAAVFDRIVATLLAIMLHVEAGIKKPKPRSKPAPCRHWIEMIEPIERGSVIAGLLQDVQAGRAAEWAGDVRISNRRTEGRSVKMWRAKPALGALERRLFRNHALAGHEIQIRREAVVLPRNPCGRRAWCPR